VSAILYIHGFNSSGNSGKVAALRSAFSDMEVSSPTFSHRAGETASRVSDETKLLMRRHAGEVVIVGTSMGGFWANWAASLMGLRAVLINPALHPSQTLRMAIGQEMEPGVVWSQENCDEYVEFERQGSDRMRQPMTVMVALDDEVIQPGLTIEYFKPFAKVAVYSAGGHRFNDYDEICRKVLETLDK
jgi:predicted esterase YcpF (UPF0227 family)